MKGEVAGRDECLAWVAALFLEGSCSFLLFRAICVSKVVSQASTWINIVVVFLAVWFQIGVCLLYDTGGRQTTVRLWHSGIVGGFGFTMDTSTADLRSSVSSSHNEP